MRYTIHPLPNYQNPDHFGRHLHIQRRIPRAREGKARIPRVRGPLNSLVLSPPSPIYRLFLFLKSYRDSVAQLPADSSAYDSKKFAALHQSPSPSFETLRNGPEAGLAAAKSNDSENGESSPSTHSMRRSIWDYLQPGDARNRTVQGRSSSSL